MKFINLKNADLIISNEYVPFEKIIAHEKVIHDRKNSLKKYLLSYKDYSIIPSIICCSKTNMIVDGHHRFFTMKELGVKMIPVTFINYMDKTIRTHSKKSLELSKEAIIENSINNNLLEPKSTIHQIYTSDEIWKPLILISTMAEIKFNN